MIVDKLKESILDSAFKGLLGTNNSVELKEKCIECNEKPYIIPDNWAFSKMKNVCISIYDGSHNPPPDSKIGIPILSAKDVYDHKININDSARYVLEEDYEKENRKVNLEKGDVLLTIVGTIGRTAIIENDTKVCFQRSVSILKPNSINSKYLMFYLESPYCKEVYRKEAKGTVQLGFYLDSVKKITIPIPPLEEQKRIVNKIEEIFAKLDELKPIENELSNLKNNFATQLKQSILFNYILGLSDKNKIPLNDYNKIGLPNYWKWIKVKDIADLRMGKTILARDLIENGIPVYSATISSEPFGFVEEIDYKLKKGDIVIPARGNSIGYATYIQDDVATCTQTTIGCRITSEQVFSKYFYYCCYAFKNVWFKYTGSAIPQITISNIKENYLPLPPLEEQKRIINIIEELLPLCNDIDKLVN